jgi:hypothetical protein
MKAVLIWAGVGFVAAAMLLGCATGTRTCVTAFDTCHAEQAGKAGYPCVCRYQFHANTGIYAGGR